MQVEAKNRPESELVKMLATTEVRRGNNLTLLAEILVTQPTETHCAFKVRFVASCDVTDIDGVAADGAVFLLLQLTSDIWACQNARSVCKAWNMTVASLTDGQVI